MECRWNSAGKLESLSPLEGIDELTLNRFQLTSLKEAENQEQGDQMGIFLFIIDDQKYVIYII